MPLEHNLLNDITDTSEWVKHLHSIRAYDWKVPDALASHLRLGTLTPPPLAADIVSFFTKEGDQVFDPFAGEGGILVGAAMANRLAAGCDLYKENIKTAAKVGEFYGRPQGNYWHMIRADAVAFLEDCVKRQPGTQDLLFTDPPWGINHGRTLDKGGKVPFGMTGKDKQDIGALSSWEAFYSYIGTVARLSVELLKPGAYALFWFGDRHRGGQYRVVGAEAAAYIQPEGLRLKGVQHFYPRVPNVRRQVFGWGRVFVPLVDHFSLYIYRKEKGRAKA